MENLFPDEVNRGDCVCLPAPSVAAGERKCPASVSLANAVPSTSTAGITPVREKISLRERQRCSFKLPASEAYRLRRIAEAQPITLKSLGFFLIAYILLLFLQRRFRKVFSVSF